MIKKTTARKLTLEARRRVAGLTLLVCTCVFFNSIQLAYGNDWGGEDEDSDQIKARSADKIEVSTPSYRPDFAQFNPPLGTYFYKVSWQGLAAADATLAVNQVGKAYDLIATAKTYSGIDMLFKLRYRAEGLVSAVDLKPLRTFIDHRENSKVRFTTIKFEKGGKIDSFRERQGRNGYSMSFDTENLTLDPFSAAFLARSLPWQVGETRQFDTFNGKSRYLISLTAREKTFISFNGQRREVFVIVPEVKNLTFPADNQKLREARIYLTTDEKREIPRIESEVFVGTVRVDLVKFKPLPPKDDESLLALSRLRRTALNG